MRPHLIAELGMARTFQNIALFEHLTVIDNLMLGRHQHIGYGFVAAFALARAGAQRGARQPAVRRGDRRLPRAGAVARAARRAAALRRPEAGRAGPGAGHGAEAAAARRAGGRHEPRGDRGHRPVHPRHPRRARRPDHHGRARHGPGHGPGRPGDGRRLRRADHHRRPRRGAAPPRRRAGLPRRGGGRRMASPVTRIRARAERRPDAVALRDKDLGIWREWTWAHYWEQVQLVGHALLELGIVPGRPGGDPLREPPGVAGRRHGRAGRAGGVGRHLPDQPGGRGRATCSATPAPRSWSPRTRSRSTRRSPCSDECPDLQRIVYLEPRGIRHRYDHERLLFWPDFLELRPPAPRAAPGCRSTEVLAAQQPDDLATLIYTSGHDRSAQGRDAHGVQRRVRDQGADRGGRVHGPAAGPEGPVAVLPAAVATSPSGSSPPGSTRPPAPRSTSPSRSRPSRRTCARCSRPSSSASRGSGRSCWPGSRSGSRARRGSSGHVAGFWLRVADGIGEDLVAHRGPAHRGHPAAVRRRPRVLLPGAARPARHARGPLRRVGRRADRPRGAALLHGHRRADARGLRHDREHRGRHGQPARPGQARARSARCTPAPSCASTRRPARSSPGTAASSPATGARTRPPPRP